jgi:hypothetical protein
MPLTDEIKRLYRITDPEMYEAAKTKRGFFIADKADFIAFDPDFDDPFADGWLTQINSAEAMPQDETLDDQLTQLTADVEEQMVKCRDKFQDSKFFIEKTFPDKVKIWNEFGYNNYEAARKSQVQMIQFMKNFHTTATKYKIQLIAKNYTQVMIDEIDSLRKALDDANQVQESFIGNLPVQTQARHIKNNELWETIVKVCSAGKRKFKNDFAKYQRYLLPPGEESPAALSISGLVTDSANSNPLAGAQIDVAPAGVSATTAANGRYSIGALDDGDYVLTATLANYVTQTKNVTITDGNAVEVNFQMVHV